MPKSYDRSAKKVRFTEMMPLEIYKTSAVPENTADVFCVIS